MRIEVHALDASRREDFYRLHSEHHGHGWCFCVAWWVDSFAGWDARRAEDNCALRERVMDRGDYDGYLLYVESEPAAWCQCCPRHKLAHLERRLKLAPDLEAWAIGCLFVAPSRRGQGLARALLEGVIADLKRRAVPRLEAYPRRGSELDVGELWTGPEGLVTRLGFRLQREDERLPVYRLDLS
jgi:GNAT superfamily N-acetyltransferase